MDSLTGLFYRAAINLLGPPIALAASFNGRFGGRWPERLGLKKFPPPPPGLGRLWFHAASVGEAKSAAAVMGATWAEAQKRGLTLEFFLSVNTPAGLEAAEKIFAESSETSKGLPPVTVMAAPLDFWGAPGRAMAAIKPQALVIMETELWPNLITAARQSGAKLILAAARLTERSFRRYGLVKGFMARLLNRFDLIAAMGQTERDLYEALGAAPPRLAICGNPKFDGLLESAQTPAFTRQTDRWREKIWGDGPAGPLITAGSTHPGEEEIILNAYEGVNASHPEALLLLAPRHLGRLDEVADLVEIRGYKLKETSRPGPLAKGGGPLVLLADEMGHLMHFYALSRVAIIGGSLREGLTGHNPMEAAAVRAPILFGPHMSSFAREAQGLEAVGGATQTTADGLGADLKRWLAHPAPAQACAQAAHNWLAARPPASPALAARIIDLLPDHRSHGPAR